MNKILHKIANPLYLLVWLSLSVFMAFHHEPFADEAQSYLIARDVSLTDLVRNVVRAEGHPLLWYLWLKCLLFLGLGYSYISLASIIPNFLGVWLFIKRAPFSPIIRFLFPLTYFIFFQYNIIARNYSFLFLMIVLVSIFYNQRKEHPWMYLITLFMLGQTTIYTFILSCGIFIQSTYEDWRNKHIIVKEIPFFIIYILLTILLLYPNPQNNYLISLSKLSQVLFSTICTISTGIITYGSYLGDTIQLLLGILYFVYAIIEIIKLDCKRFILWLLPLLCFSCYANQAWHGGIFILTTMLILWQNPQKKLSKEFKCLISIFFIMQIIWSVNAFINEINGKYSAGKEVAAFLHQQNIPTAKVLKLQFNTTSICPYYTDENCSYWDWEKYQSDRKFVLNEIYQYDAYIINQERYNNTPEKWDERQQQLGYQRQIFKSQFFVASISASAEETLYVYYRKSPK